MRQVPGLGSPAAGCASPIGPRCPCLTGWVRRYAQVFPQLGPSGSSSRPCQSGQPATPRTAHGSQSGRSYCEDDFDASPLTPTVPCLAVAINIFGTSAGSIAPGLPRRHASAPRRTRCAAGPACVAANVCAYHRDVSMPPAAMSRLPRRAAFRAMPSAMPPSPVCRRPCRRDCPSLTPPLPSTLSPSPPTPHPPCCRSHVCRR